MCSQRFPNNAESRQSPEFPTPPARVFLVGIGGIGMSALAQFLAWHGYRVAGSDRDLTGPGRASLYRALRALGILIFPQDGSGPRATHPDALICSAAIEPGNPDLNSARNARVFGRAEALAMLLDRTPGRQIAVAGSAGKTTVTAWTASALRALGEPVLVVCGGFIREFATPVRPGNFFADSAPRWLVYEADESDGSLVHYTPHIGAILNVGTDHLDRPRLLELFQTFALHCRCCTVAHADLYHALPLPDTDSAKHAAVPDPADCTPGPPRRVFFNAPAETACTAPADSGQDIHVIPAPVDVRTNRDGVHFRIPGYGSLDQAWQFGDHSAWNACAVLGILYGASGSSVSLPTALGALADFRGVVRRFERVGESPDGAPVIDDYAHNIEKLQSALRTAQALAPNGILAFFQPHGYGPLGFMRRALVTMLCKTLRPADLFTFLPVYYAGGTTSFTPKAEEVMREAREAGAPVAFCATREEAARLAAETGSARDLILVLGARDPSLGDWARSLCAVPGNS